jgi:ACS family tartrate transporter-like MFS transporter
MRATSKLDRNVLYRGRIVGLFISSVTISNVIGAPISGAILDMEGIAGLHGWQWMFLIEALPSLLMSFVLLCYLTDRPQLANWLNHDERKWLQERLDAERANRETFFNEGWLKSMISPRVLVLGAVYFCIQTPLYSLAFFLPQIVKDFGLTNVEAGFVTAIPYVIATVGMVLWGRHSDRSCERKWHVIVAFSTITVGLGLAAVNTSPMIQMILMCVATWGFFSILPVFWTFPAAFLSGAGAAAGIAAINSIGTIGGFLGPSIFGQLRDWTGSDFAGLIFLASLPIIGIVIVLVLGHNPSLERPATARPTIAS